MTSSTSDLSAVPNADDEFLWLEDIYGNKQLDWVRAENKVTEDLLAATGFEQTEKRLLEVLDSTDRIPMAAKRGGHYYNFWRDAEHPKGLWRRTTWDSYCTEDPQWEILLDLDELSRTEGMEWVWGGSAFLRPADGTSYRRALVVLVAQPSATDYTPHTSSARAARPLHHPLDRCTC